MSTCRKLPNIMLNSKKERSSEEKNKAPYHKSRICLPDTLRGRHDVVQLQELHGAGMVPCQAGLMQKAGGREEGWPTLSVLHF